MKVTLPSVISRRALFAGASPSAVSVCPRTQTTQSVSASGPRGPSSLAPCGPMSSSASCPEWCLSNATCSVRRCPEGAAPGAVAQTLLCTSGTGSSAPPPYFRHWVVSPSPVLPAHWVFSGQRWLCRSVSCPGREHPESRPLLAVTPFFPAPLTLTQTRSRKTCEL